MLSVLWKIWFFVFDILNALEDKIEARKNGNKK